MFRPTRWSFWGLLAVSGALGANCTQSGSSGADGHEESLGGAGRADRGIRPREGVAGASPGGADGFAPETPPVWLSQTGLYSDESQSVAPGVRRYRPRFELWSDGTTKRRWIQLPEGSRIDVNDVDFWKYPIGTRLWKEFSVEGLRVETRLLEKRPHGGWWMVSYLWQEDQSDARAVPAGRNDVLGTSHDIPSSQQCLACHGKMTDKVLGFSAVQLDLSQEQLLDWDMQLAGQGGAGGVGPQPELDLLTLDELGASGRLTAMVEVPPLPGTQEARAALGYLHANCGNCHNRSSSVTGRVGLLTWLEIDTLGSLAQTATFRSAVGVAPNLFEGPQGATALIDPQSASTSDLWLRMGLRGEEGAMPPLGSEEVDQVGQGLLAEWIGQLQ